jgi:hypothetical protein
MIDGKHIYMGLLCGKFQSQLLLDRVEEARIGLNTISRLREGWRVTAEQGVAGVKVTVRSYLPVRPVWSTTGRSRTSD